MIPQASRTSLDASIETMPRELDSRTNDGIHVSLLWYPHNRHVSVTVHDTKTGEEFELQVRDDQRPLDVFRHPYAYTTHPAATARERRKLGTRCGS